MWASRFEAVRQPGDDPPGQVEEGELDARQPGHRIGDDCGGIEWVRPVGEKRERVSLATRLVNGGRNAGDQVDVGIAGEAHAITAVCREWDDEIAKIAGGRVPGEGSGRGGCGKGGIVARGE